MSPLDWGLGHTTRCIPIIAQLIKQGHIVTAAVNNTQRAVLKDAFPKLNYTHLDGYNVEYAKSGSMAWMMAKQSAKIISKIKSESEWVKQYIESNPQDFIISDNRFGFHHPRIECIYITHQINIQGPNLLKPILYGIHKNYIDKFHHCLIPDTTDSLLAGQLSKTHIKRFKYIGAISRFSKPTTNTGCEFEYLGIVSGPEPQRSVFCKILETKFLESNKKCAIIGGQPLAKNQYQEGNLTYFNHLSSEEFESIAAKSKQVISRPGYSTIMDFSILQKPIFFIPTPGQTEQEYLAKYHKKKHKIGFSHQNNFELNDDLSFGIIPNTNSSENLTEVLKKIIR